MGGDSDTEDMRSKTVKRKLEDLPENTRKLAKTSNLTENCHLYEGKISELLSYSVKVTTENIVKQFCLFSSSQGFANYSLRANPASPLFS